MVAPKELRDKWILPFCSAILNWRITSNQSRTFSLMETLAVAIGKDANKIAGSIRAKLTEEEKALPIIEEEMDSVDVYVTPSAAGYVITKSETMMALDDAKTKLEELINTFDFENQLQNS